MDNSFEVFDFHRIFIGDAPLTYLLEIIFRTIIMYGYTIFLLRILGKRGMGQLSSLELAIIISFGSAVGDPMIAEDMPILHGMVAITTITLLQIGLERMINRHKKVEAFMEGTPNLIVDDGLIQLKCLLEENLSREDVFRALRGKEVEHLGQINKAFFETSSKISVLFHAPKILKPGLTVLPEKEIPVTSIIKAATTVKKAGLYACINCGKVESLEKNKKAPTYKECAGEEWIEAIS